RRPLAPDNGSEEQRDPLPGRRPQEGSRRVAQYPRTEDDRSSERLSRRRQRGLRLPRISAGPECTSEVRDLETADTLTLAFSRRSFAFSPSRGELLQSRARDLSGIPHPGGAWVCAAEFWSSTSRTLAASESGANGLGRKK